MSTGNGRGVWDREFSFLGTRRVEETVLVVVEGALDLATNPPPTGKAAIFIAADLSYAAHPDE